MRPPIKKRTDYAKLDKDREQIVRSMEDLEHVPQSERMFPNLLEQGRRFVVGAIKKSNANYRYNRMQKALGSPPVIEGGKVIGKRRNTSPV